MAIKKTSNGVKNTEYSIVITRKELKKLLLKADRVPTWIFRLEAIVTGVSYQVTTDDLTTMLFLKSKFDPKQEKVAA